MATKSSWLFPCSTFFAVSRSAAGCLALVMQITLVLWPVAVRWARAAEDKQGVDRMLAEISETYRVPSENIYARHKKRFDRPQHTRAA